MGTFTRTLQSLARTSLPRARRGQVRRSRTGQGWKRAQRQPLSIRGIDFLRLAARPNKRTWRLRSYPDSPSLDNEEIRVGERQVGAQSGEVNAPTSPTSIGVIVEFASVLLVDNAVAAVAGKAGRIGRERRLMRAYPRQSAR